MQTVLFWILLLGSSVTLFSSEDDQHKSEYDQQQLLLLARKESSLRRTLPSHSSFQRRLDDFNREAEQLLKNLQRLQLDEPGSTSPLDPMLWATFKSLCYGADELNEECATIASRNALSMKIMSDDNEPLVESPLGFDAVDSFRAILVRIVEASNGRLSLHRVPSRLLSPEASLSNKKSIVLPPRVFQLREEINLHGLQDIVSVTAVEGSDDEAEASFQDDRTGCVVPVNTPAADIPLPAGRSVRS